MTKGEGTREGRRREEGRARASEGSRILVLSARSDLLSSPWQASRSRDRGKAADGLTWPLTPMHYSVRSARSSVRPAIQITMPPRLLSSDYRQADCETGGKGGRTLATRINHGENQFNVKLSLPFPDPDSPHCTSFTSFLRSHARSRSSHGGAIFDQLHPVLHPSPPLRLPLTCQP